MLHQGADGDGDDGKELVFAPALSLPAEWILTPQKVTFSIVQTAESEYYVSCTFLLGKNL